MTHRFKVRFDGRVLVPEEPVDLPTGQTLEVRVEGGERGSASDDERAGDIGAYLLAWLEKNPPITNDGLPNDLAAQVDHYLYGAPRQP